MLKALAAKGEWRFLSGHRCQTKWAAGFYVGIFGALCQFVLGRHPKPRKRFGTMAALRVGLCHLQSTDLQAAAECPRTPLQPRLLFPATDCRSLEHAVKGGHRVSPPLVPANFWGTYH